MHSAVAAAGHSALRSKTTLRYPSRKAAIAVIRANCPPPIIPKTGDLASAVA